MSQYFGFTDLNGETYLNCSLKNKLWLPSFIFCDRSGKLMRMKI